MTEQKIKLPLVQNISLKDAGNGNSIILNWENLNSKYLTNYKVYWGTDSTSTLNSSTTIANNLTIGNLSYWVKYYFRICGVSVDGNEGIANIISGTPNIIPGAANSFKDQPFKKKILFAWNKNNENDILGYNIYKSDSKIGSYKKINSLIIKDTLFTDEAVINGRYYFYYVSAVDSLGNESINNPIIRSRCISLDQGILLVDNTFNDDGTLFHPSDKEVDDFYEYLMQGYEHKFYDLKEEGEIKLADLGAFSTVIWYDDNYKGIPVGMVYNIV